MWDRVQNDEVVQSGRESQRVIILLSIAISWNFLWVNIPKIFDEAWKSAHPLHICYE